MAFCGVVKKVELARWLHLPVELLYEIFVLSCSPSLPLTSRRTYQIFKNAPASLQAEYIFAKWAESQTQNPRLGLVTATLRYPVCTQEVLEAILRLPTCPKNLNECPIQLPRRLFRSLSSLTTKPWTGDDHPLPFLRYLYQHSRFPRPQADSWEGYPLTKAVASKFMPLVRFLLEEGASPAPKDGLAVHVAIRLRDLSLVKLLIEPSDSAACFSPETTSQGRHPRVEIRRKRQSEEEGGTKSVKKRRIEDRVSVTQEMLQTAVACNARDVVEYFMHEKDCMPDMHTVKLVNRGQTAVGGGGVRKRKTAVRRRTQAT